MARFDYTHSNLRIPGYLCLRCGKQNVKLWREQRYFARDMRLRCVTCACRYVDIDPNTVNAQGLRPRPDHSMTNWLRSLVPAIPALLDEGVLKFYSDAAAPPAAWRWWIALP